MLRFRSLCLLAFLLLGVGFASTLAQGIDVPPPSPTDAGDPDLLSDEGKLHLPAGNWEEVTKVAVSKNNEISFKAVYPTGCDLGNIPANDLKFKLKYGACEVGLGWELSSFKLGDNTVAHKNKTVDVSIKGSGFTLTNSEHVQVSGDTKCSKFGDNLETNEKGEYAVEVSATKSKQCNLQLEIANKKFIASTTTATTTTTPTTTTTTITTAAPQEESSSISKAFVGSTLFWIILVASVLAVVIVISVISVLIWRCLRKRNQMNDRDEYQSLPPKEELNLVTCISHEPEEVLATAKEKTAPKNVGTKVDRAALQKLKQEAIMSKETKELATPEGGTEYPQPKHRHQYVDLSKVKSSYSAKDGIQEQKAEQKKPGVGPTQEPLKKDAKKLGVGPTQVPLNTDAKGAVGAASKA